MLPFFFIGGPNWTAGPLYHAVWNMGHTIFFGFLMVGIRLYRGIGGWRQVVVVSIGVLLAGIFIEAIQSQIGRQLDWRDIVRNLIGIWVVLAWQGWRGASSVVLWTARALTASVLATQLFMVGNTALEQNRIAHQLPLLADIASSSVQRQWSGDAKYAIADGPGSGKSLRIRFQAGRLSTAWLDNMPTDWRGYDRLILQLYNPEPRAVSLTLRINDLEHDLSSNAHNDRFNRRLYVAPGWNRFEFPLSDVDAAPATRTMNMHQVVRLGLFTSALERPRTLYLDQIRLH